MLSNPNKVNILINFYNHVHQETIRYRDLEIKFVVIVVALFAGLITSVTKFSCHLQFWCIKLFLLMFSLAIAIYGIWFIGDCHRKFIKNRNWLKTCEKIFELHSENVYNKNSVLCKELSEPVVIKDKLKYSIAFWILIIAMYAFTSYMIVVL